MEVNTLASSPSQEEETHIATPIGFHSNPSMLHPIESTQSLHNLTLQLAEDSLDSDFHASTTSLGLGEY